MLKNWGDDITLKATNAPFFIFGPMRLGDFKKIAVFRFALSGGKPVLKVRKNMDKISRKTRSFVSYSTTSTQA